MDPRKLPKTISVEDAKKLLDVPNLDTPTGMRNRVCMELMYRCGLRVGETIGLVVRDIKKADGQLLLRAEITKGDRDAYIPVPEATMRGLDRWKVARRKLANPEVPNLLITKSGQPFTRQAAYRMVHRYAERAGIGHCTPHMLRHSFATHALNDGASIRKVQEILRHTFVETTMIYTHVTQDELKEFMKDRGGDEW